MKKRLDQEAGKPLNNEPDVSDLVARGDHGAAHKSLLEQRVEERTAEVQAANALLREREERLEESNQRLTMILNAMESKKRRVPAITMTEEPELNPESWTISTDPRTLITKITACALARKSTSSTRSLPRFS